jgi:hypothetical protein
MSSTEAALFQNMEGMLTDQATKTKANSRFLGGASEILDRSIIRNDSDAVWERGTSDPSIADQWNERPIKHEHK